MRTAGEHVNMTNYGIIRLTFILLDQFQYESTHICHLTHRVEIKLISFDLLSFGELKLETELAVSYISKIAVNWTAEDEFNRERLKTGRVHWLQLQ